METSAQYLRFAEECERLANMAMTEQQRMILKDMAEVWRELAAEKLSAQ